MIKNEFLNWLRSGGNYMGIQLDQSLQSAYEIMGSPLLVEGNSEFGFYVYGNGLRIGYMDGVIDEISHSFQDKEDVCIPIDIPRLTDLKYINNTILLHQFIHIINLAGVTWVNYNEGQEDVLTIRTQGGVYVGFSLETGLLFKICKNR